MVVAYEVPRLSLDESKTTNCNCFLCGCPKQFSDESDQFVGISSVAVDVRKSIELFAQNEEPVFMTGNTGTGKTLAAKLVHRASERAGRDFFVINCTSLPGEIADSILFGSRKGSFTGAHKDRGGYFSFARGGTIVLEEVSDIPLELQGKLLRVVEEKVVRPIGSKSEEPVDVRIIATSNANIPELVKQGKFRGDLYYRLAVFEMAIPPLVERMCDLQVIAYHLLTAIAKKHQREVHADISVVHKLRAHTWPGNIRELKNVLLAAFLRSQGRMTESDVILPLLATAVNEVSPTTPDGEFIHRKYISPKDMNRILALMEIAEGACISDVSRQRRISRSALHNWIRRLNQEK